MPLPGLSDQYEIKPIFRNKLKWKSYTTLILLFVLGAGTIIASYFVSTYSLEKRIGDLETSKEELLMEIGNQSFDPEKLEMTPEPDPALLQQYAYKIPADRELPRFLLQLDQLAQKTGLKITNIGIDNEPTLKMDMLRDYLAKLDALAQNVGNNQDSGVNTGNNQNPGVNVGNNQNSGVNVGNNQNPGMNVGNNQNPGINIGSNQSPGAENQDVTNNPPNTSPSLPPEEAARWERLFLSNPSQFAKEFPLKNEQNLTEDQAQSDKQEERSQQGAEAYQALQSYIPIGMIGLTIESDSNLQQVMQFLGEMRKGPRLVYFEEWSYAHDKKNPARTIFTIKLHIFYYKDVSGLIPPLPPLQFTQ